MYFIFYTTIEIEKCRIGNLEHFKKIKIHQYYTQRSVTQPINQFLCLTRSLHLFLLKNNTFVLRRQSCYFSKIVQGEYY